ncbi:MAG: hypothetical protein UV00_C0032G0008 [candidate division WWE3 bacterium GW2011_GWF1_42_14]|uniref:Uncharacterized protein n=1 Tax=candidate division WWE3 bacterium GW2011_GWF1_42_14 TaxID=1619138 RepID=A0A0G0YG30_UNCKA|nr:MAG: hypothetical protein UV00_C0032G0008 [candidate division WWE3 bacterium GW2011_GWF1_42_14]
MTEPSTVEIRIRKDSVNVRYREYYVDRKMSQVAHRIYTLPLGDVKTEKLESDIGPIGSALITMLSKIDTLDFVYLTYYSIGLSKKRGKDWKAIEQAVFLDIQTALGATAYRTRSW